MQPFLLLLLIVLVILQALPISTGENQSSSFVGSEYNSTATESLSSTRTSTTTATTTTSTATTHRQDIQDLVREVREWLEHFVVLGPIHDVSINGYDHIGSQFHSGDNGTVPSMEDEPWDASSRLTQGLTSVKGFTKFVHTLLVGCSDSTTPGTGCWSDDDVVQAFQDMGSLPLKQYLREESLDHNTISTDTGGGSGAGFHICCYNSILLSTGGGGGGGVKPRYVAAGGGAGMQIRLGAGMEIVLPMANSNVSYGGGLEYPGTKLLLDHDSVDCRTFCHTLDRLVPILRQCHLEGHLHVVGGGGGGGGVTLPNPSQDHVLSSGFGFGFSIFGTKAELGNCAK